MAATAWHTVRCERRYHVNNLHYLCLPSASNFSFNLLGLGQGWRKCWRARDQIADTFRRNTFACGNLNLLAPYFRFFQWRLNAPYTLRPGQLPGCPAPESGLALIRPWEFQLPHSLVDWWFGYWPSLQSVQKTKLLVIGCIAFFKSHK
jgi:hypothetical protein